VNNDVLVIIGVGGMGVAVARRCGAGRTILLADINAEGLDATAAVLTGDGHQVLTREVDVTSRSSVAAVAEAAKGAGRVTSVVHTAGLSPQQASTEAVLAVDLLIIGRRPHEPSMKESGAWVAFYVGLAVLFGIGVWVLAGGRYAGEFYTGWLTEYSLSVDNLFVFVIIMARFAVPRRFQQKVLLIGIVLALVMRGLFIAAGAALIAQFSWVFYIFGAFLVYTAITLLKEGENDENDFQENILIRWAKRAMLAKISSALLVHIKGFGSALCTSRNS